MKTTVLLSFFLLMSGVSWGQIADLSQEKKNQLFKEKTEQRISDLETNIKIIGDKKSENDAKIRAVNATVKYFDSEDVSFEVSSLNTGTKRYKVRQYLNKLKDLPYYQVEIKWLQSKWVSDFQKAPNGKWYGTVRLFQVFKGTGADGQNLYSDMTKKDISVEIDIVKITTSNGDKEVLIVTLGDVNVVETSKA